MFIWHEEVKYYWRWRHREDGSYLPTGLPEFNEPDTPEGVLNFLEQEHRGMNKYDLIITRWE